MNQGLISPRLMVGAAIVGIVGAAGVFIYEQIYAEKRRAMLVREVARLDKQVSSMKTELENLRELQKETTLRRLKQKKVRRERPVRKVPSSGDKVEVTEHSYASDSEYFTDYQSVLGGTDGELDSEEFYDVPTDDDEDDTLRESLRNGHAGNELPDEEVSENDKVEKPVTATKNAT
ncbi:DNA-binding protein modulo-like [Helicoverpa zea]|uniref:DNA-binding protein modulo-like n=1 Tax=Helicoverpa zea TaxID=7113 RepID=UPI001F5AD742|nr:DNA-binding protein modulo-like [Helicoverpa zea]